MKDLESLLRGLVRNAIRLSVPEGDGPVVGRFGGVPDVPPDFVWPVFETDSFVDDEVKKRPLSFLAQFDCAALAPLDTEGMLPHDGLLSFFYELESQRWGFDPKDAGCARVYWFSDKGVLAPAEFPAAMPDYCRLPVLPFRGRRQPEYPAYEEFAALPDLLGPCHGTGQSPWEVFGGLRSVQPGYQEAQPPWHRLLGWPDIIQNCMAQECALISRGYYTGSGFQDIPETVLRETETAFLDDWRLLFQMDSGIRTGDFCLDFGDSGSIYFYIRRDDLAARRFDRVWLILQCC